MKFLSTFKITKGFDNWLKMYKEIEPDIPELETSMSIVWVTSSVLLACSPVTLS